MQTRYCEQLLFAWLCAACEKLQSFVIIFIFLAAFIHKPEMQIRRYVTVPIFFTFSAIRFGY